MISKKVLKFILSEQKNILKILLVTKIFSVDPYIIWEW